MTKSETIIGLFLLVAYFTTGAAVGALLVDRAYQKELNK